jgi:ComF family protein
MSIFRGLVAFPMLKISPASRRVLPLPGPAQDCLLCGAFAGTNLVCDACERDLPRLGAHCERCAVPLPQAGLCGNCRAHAPAFDRALAVFEYRFPVDRLVQRFKYSADLACGRWLARELARSCALEPRPDLVFAPPLSRGRLRSRGFNQALELARHVGRQLGVRCVVRGLHKNFDTAPQPGLGRRARRAKLRGAFACTVALRGARVALVDDVMTTGATADALAAVLKRAGAAEVSVWAVARTPEPR